MIVPGPPWQTTTAASRTIASISAWPRYWRCSARRGTAEVPVWTKQRAESGAAALEPGVHPAREAIEGVVVGADRGEHEGQVVAQKSPPITRAPG